MSAASTSAAEIGEYGSDSDTDSEESPEYYQPLSALDGDEDECGDLSAEDNIIIPTLPNGSVTDGVSALDLSDEDGGEAEEEARSDAQTERAFQEDERRRSAPLPRDDSVRVIEAMRGVSFAGTLPEWADQVSEDQWLDRLRRLRHHRS
ncbi:hypothetical protein M569_03419 [Genlisea aurea]|uniref:Male-enhanced antigen 1 n=1 Tax=Genlisea aurea TaxID=192259 RepID=S8EFJ2_9LAMI|nr:hypothetical protein M569_03419 [Genlisea aurea]